MIFKTIDDNDSLSGQRIVSKFTARKIAQEEATKQLEIDIQCLRNYEIECQKGSVSTETFSNTMKGASVEAQKYAVNIKNGTGSAQTFATNQKAIQASMSETSIVSKVAATGLSIFKAALNSLIFFAVIEGIQLLIKGIDNLILTADEAEEKAEALRGNMQSFFDEVQSGQQTISSVSDRFSELSEHVTKTGENIDLTKDEYSEYLDICNQVKTIMPELVTGYTNEGNAIITLKDNVDNLTESYKENIRAKAAAFITNGDDDGNTIQSFFDDYKIFTEGENGLFAPSAGGLWNNKSTDYEDYYGYDKVHEWLEDVADLSLKDLQNLQKGTTQATYLYALLKENGYELANITEDNYEAVHDVLDTRLTSLEGEMATRVSNVKMSLQQMLYADRDYWDIDDNEALSAIDSMFSSIDSEFIKQNNLLGQDALQSFESNVIKLFENKDTQKAMIDIYTPQGDDESIEDYSKRVNDAIEKVQNYVKDKKIDVPIDFTDATGSVEDLQKSYEDTINRFKSSEEANLEELKQSYQEAIDKRKELYSGENYVGNVDINNRPVVINDDGSYSTTSTSFQEKWVGDEENGHYIIAHFTPILPDGTVLDEDSLNEYIDKILNSDDPMEADKVENGGKGIVYKVDTQINGKDITDDNLEDAFGVADAWDVDMHNLQDKMYKDEAAIKAQIAKFDDGVDGSQKIKDFFDTEGINTDEEINEFNEVTKGINDADKAIQTWNEHKKESNETPILSTDELKEKLSDLNSAIDNIQSAYDTLNSAVEEYNSNGGQLSIDTIQSLLSLSDEYLACLQVENGQLSLNADAMSKLAQSKLDEAQATAVTQAMTELQAIANGEAAQSTTTYISGNAALMDSLAQLSGSYEGVAQAAMTAAQAQELSAQISAASAKDKTATENVMKGLDTKLKLIQSTKNAVSAGNFASVSKKKSSSGSSSKSSKSSKDELKEQFQAEYDLLKHNLEMEYITEEQYYNGVQALNEKYFAGKEEYLDEYRKYEEEVYKGLKSYYKSYCDDMMDYYDKKLDASKMSYKEYCDSVSKMLADMHNSGKISDKDWYDYTKTMLEKQKDAYDRALSAITRRLQKEIDAWQAKIDALNDQNDALNEQKDNMDFAIDAITRVYDAEIDRIQGIIDGLKDANDERERTLALEQAKYELEKAYSQRVKKIYTEGKGYTYEVDYDAIKDAQKTYNDTELDVKTDELQKQIETLEEFKKKWQEIPDEYQRNIDAMNATALLGSEYQKLILNNNIIDIENFKTKYLAIQAKINDNEELIKSYNEKVDYYNKLKDQWSSLSDEYSNSVDDMYAKMLIGQSWETDVLNGRLSTLNDFRNQYNDIQKSISDMAWQSANAQISALNAVKAAEATKAQTSGGSNSYSGSSGTTTSVGGNTSGGSGLTAAQKYQVRLAGTVIVIYEGSSETDLRNWITRNNYIGVSRTIQGNIIIYFAKKKEKKYIGQVYKTSGQAASQVGMLGGAGYDKVSGGYQVYKYAKGTNNAKPGIARVSEKEYGDEILIKNDNTATLVRGEQLVNFEGGEKVIPANETKEILKNQGNVESLSDSDVITRKDGSILKPIHYEYENILTNFIKDNPDYMYSINNMSDNLCRDLFKNAENINYDNRSVDNRVSIGEIHLHEVQNVDQFARELDRQLAGIVDQKLSRRKR